MTEARIQGDIVEAKEALLAFRHGDTKHLTREHARILFDALPQESKGGMESALSLGAEHPANYRLAFARTWTPEQFWEYVEGLTDPLVRDQMRDMMRSQGLSLSSTVRGGRDAD